MSGGQITDVLDWKDCSAVPRQLMRWRNEQINYGEIQLCNEIYYGFDNCTAVKSTPDTASIELRFNTLKQRPAPDLIAPQNEKEVLPVANPYVAIYLIVIVSSSVIFNSLVLTVLGLRRKKLRTFQLYLVSVCVSDLLFSLLLHPMSIATALGYDAHRIFNHSGCLYFGILALFFGSFDMVIHSAIAALRYINVCHPARIGWFLRRTTLSLILACVLYSMLWCIGPAFGIGKYVTFEVGCTMAFTDESLSGRAFVNCAFIFVFFIPLTVTIFSYVAIVIEAGKQRRQLERIGTVITFRNRLAMEMKLVRLTCVIASAYIVVWLPYAVVCLSEAYGDVESLPWSFRISAALFCKTGTATNPILYLFMSKGFRLEACETMRELLTCKNRSFVPSLLTNSSPKTSSYRSHSQISFRSSWQSRLRKEQSSLQKIQSNITTSGHASTNPLETSV